MSSSPSQYKLNDVVYVRVRFSHTDPNFILLADPDFPEFGNDSYYRDVVHEFRVVGAPGQLPTWTPDTYVLVIDESILSSDLRFNINRLSTSLCMKWKIDYKFEGHPYAVVVGKTILRKDSLKTYELYQRSDLEEGATCRGPCKMHNKYADPDNDCNRTYVCRSCKQHYEMMGIAC